MAESRGAWGWSGRRPQLDPIVLRRARPRVLPVVLLVAGGVLAGVLLFLAASGLGGGASSATPAAGWSSTAGAGVRASFLASCQGHGASAGSCVCVFDHLIAQPAYATPAAFEALDPDALHPSATAASALSSAKAACARTSTRAGGGAGANSPV